MAKSKKDGDIPKSMEMPRDKVIEEIKQLFANEGKSLSEEEVTNITEIFKKSINLGEDPQKEQKVKLSEKYSTPLFKKLERIFNDYGKKELSFEAGFELEDIYHDMATKRQNKAVEEIKHTFALEGKELKREALEQVTQRFKNAEMIDTHTPQDKLNQFEIMPKSSIQRKVEHIFNRYKRVLDTESASYFEDVYNSAAVSEITTRDRLDRGIRKISRALVPKIGDVVNSARVGIAESDAYFTEIALDKQFTEFLPGVRTGEERPIHKMTSKELRKYRLHYDQVNQRLVDNEGNVATTMGETNKEITDHQVVVMSQAGRLYVGPHGAVQCMAPIWTIEQQRQQEQ